MGKRLTNVEKVLRQAKQYKCREQLRKDILVGIDMLLKHFFENIDRAERGEEFVEIEEYLKEMEK